MTQIDWHPYPEETPPETGFYLCTILDVSGLWTDDKYYIDIDGGFISEFGEEITAWAYPIEPYRRGK